MCVCLFWFTHSLKAAADPKQEYVGTSEIEQMYVSAFKKK